MKFINNKSLLGISLIVLLMVSCDKTKPYDLITPPAVAHFMGLKTASYYVQNDPASVYNVTIGSTTVSKLDRKVNFTVSSPTGASASQYTLGVTGTVTIPAGQTSATIPVKGIFAGYPSTRRDTLIFTITGGDLPPADYNPTFALVLQRYCTVTLSNFVGNYTQSFDIQPPSPNYGPYKTVFSNPISTGASTGTIQIANFWDVGGPNITVNLDWTNPANFTTTIPQQFLYTDATYGAATIKPVGTGTFSSCDNTFTFSYTVTVSAGSFGNFTTTIKR